MMGEAQYMVRLPDEREFGPATIDLIEQWTREGRVPAAALLVPTQGGSVRSVLTEPRLQQLLSLLQPMLPAGTMSQTPPVHSTGLPQQPDGAMSGMIPYKNPPALVGYYLAVVSLLPFVGMVFGIAAVILGIIGLRKRLREPRVRGLAHAWVAIILGGITTIGYGGLFLIAILSSRSY